MLRLCGCYLRAHKELRASPLKPNVSTWMRSEKSLSFDVWCFNAVERSEEVSLDQKDQLDFDYLGEGKQKWHLLSPSKLASSTPLPLSDTSTSSAPHSFSLTSGTCNNVIQKCSSHEQLVGYQNLISRTEDPSITLCAEILTYVGGPCIYAVFHQLFDSGGQSQNHLSRADLMHWVLIDGLDGSGRFRAAEKKSHNDV